MSIDDMITEIEKGQTSPVTTAQRVLVPYANRKAYGLGIRRGLDSPTVRAFCLSIGDQGQTQYHFYDYSLRKVVQKAYEQLTGRSAGPDSDTGPQNEEIA